MSIINNYCRIMTIVIDVLNILWHSLLFTIQDLGRSKDGGEEEKMEYERVFCSQCSGQDHPDSVTANGYCEKCGKREKIVKTPWCRKCDKWLALPCDPVGVHYEFCSKCGLSFEAAKAYKANPIRRFLRWWLD